MHFSPKGSGEFVIDAFILELFIIKERRCGGSFVELGARDGLISHTAGFESKLGWHGTCIEGSPYNFEKLNQTRRVCRKVPAVVWSREQKLTFRTYAPGVHLSGHNGIVEALPQSYWDSLTRQHPSDNFTDVPVRGAPIASIIPHLTSIDWFVLDVEARRIRHKLQHALTIMR